MFISGTGTISTVSFGPYGEVFVHHEIIPVWTIEANDWLGPREAWARFKPMAMEEGDE